MLSIVVFDHQTLERAEPIFSTSDPLIVGEVRRLLAVRMSLAEANREAVAFDEGPEDRTI